MKSKNCDEGKRKQICAFGCLMSDKLQKYVAIPKSIVLALLFKHVRFWEECIRYGMMFKAKVSNLWAQTSEWICYIH